MGRYQRYTGEEVLPQVQRDQMLPEKEQPTPFHQGAQETRKGTQRLTLPQRQTLSPKVLSHSSQ